MEKHATFHEYTAAADPSTFMAAVPLGVFPASLHEAPDGPSGVLDLDASAALGVPGPATTPNLAAAFVRVRAGDTVTTSAPDATSHVVYAIRGAGSTTVMPPPNAAPEELTVVAWHAGDLFTLPAGTGTAHAATADAALYWVHDGPLVRYLGAAPAAPRFPPALYTREALAAELARVNSEAGAGARNRNGVLLGNAALPETRTLTHTMWALWNALPAGVTQVRGEGAGYEVGGGSGDGRSGSGGASRRIQWQVAAAVCGGGGGGGGGADRGGGAKSAATPPSHPLPLPAPCAPPVHIGSLQPPHRHNSVALDLCVAAGPRTYTLMSPSLDAGGRLVNPVRADWRPGAVFVTPPGWWHSHHNDGDVAAIVLPVQDAGLYTHQRTLDIRFAPRAA